MSVKKADLYEHNNPDLAFVDGNSVRGARRVVADRETLYGLVVKADQLRENVTIVRILSDSENGGTASEVLLVDDANIDKSAGWSLYSSGNSTPGSGGGSGGASIPQLFAFNAPQAGAQSYPLPAGAIALSYPVLALDAISKVVKTLMHENCHFSGGNVVFGPGAAINAQDRINLAYYTGGSQTGALPPPTTPPSFELYLTPDEPDNNADSLNWGTNPGSALQLAYNPTVQPDTSAGAATMNVFLGGTDPAANQVGTLDYASTDNGHQCGVQDTAANKLYYVMQIINPDSSLGPQQAMVFYPGNILLVG